MRARRQLELELSTPRRWGGRRAGAGRKRSAERRRLPHVTRPALAARHPAHVTLRVRAGVPSLRSPILVRAFEGSLVRARKRGDFRVVHYSLQANHVHLIVEAEHRLALARGMIAVGSRLARVVNRVFRRSGRVLDDRYHVRALKTPREVRNALRYVLLNARRHARRLVGTASLDPASSARWFDGWRRRDGHGRSGSQAESCPIPRAQTWLLAFGWRRHGAIDPADVPGPG